MSVDTNHRGAPVVEGATDAHACGARGFAATDNLHIARAGDGYQRVLCRRHATELLGMRWSA